MIILLSLGFFSIKKSLTKKIYKIIFLKKMNNFSQLIDEKIGDRTNNVIDFRVIIIKSKFIYKEFYISYLRY